MKDEDYERLIVYTNHLLENEKLPEKIIPIKPIKISNNTITYSYYLIHKYLYGTTRIKVIFIDFLKSVFIQLTDTEKSSIKNQFSRKPKNYPI